jgi:AraC-like DNA-binding protein
MRRLDSGKFNNLKILAITFDSGFNSKTTFNVAFKKYSGFSPTEYRKACNSPKVLPVNTNF